MDNVTVRLTQQDLDIFDFITKFGYVSAEQLSCYFSLNLVYLKSRLSRLVKFSYLSKQRVIYAKPAVYSVTKKSNILGLAIQKQINLHDYHHDSLLVDVFIKLANKFKSYQSEKMIHASRGAGVGKFGRIPDIIAQTHSGTVVALELERTAKSIARLKTIILSYVTDANYDEVWFICANEFIFNNLHKVAWNKKIKIFKLNDVLSGLEFRHIEVATCPPMDSELQRIIGKFFT